MKTSLVLCLLAAAVSYAADIEVHLKNVTAMVGEKVVIPCDYTADIDPASENDTDVNPTITWLTVFDNGEVQRLYVKEGNTSKADLHTNRKGLSVDGKGSLVIPKAKISDNTDLKRLRCSVVFGKIGSAEADMHFAALLFPEEDPFMDINPYNKGQSGFTIRNYKVAVGVCRSKKSYPSATITFFKKAKDGESMGVKSTGVLTDIIDAPYVDISEDGLSSTTEEDLMKVLDPSDHQAEFTCNVKVAYGDKVFEKNYTMPKFNVNHETTEVHWADTPVAYLGEKIDLKCVANGFPEPTITINDEEGMEKQITITEEMDGMAYQCAATNNPSKEAVKSKKYNIKVLSLKKPVISGDEQIPVGESVTFTCSAEGKPEPTVEWFKGDTKMSDTGTLTIEKTVFEDSAEYMCKAHNGHDNLSKSSTIELSVRGLKIKGEAEEVLEAKKDDILTLECEVTSNPEAKFKWNIDDPKVTEVRSGHTYTSQLSLGPLTTEMSEKEYVCEAENEDGVLVTKKFKMPVISEASSATAGIIIAILLVILIVAIILAVLYNKGIICKKQEKGDESAEGDIAVEINNEEDVEAGNGKPAANVEETDEPGSQEEEEKLMNGQNTED